MLEQTYLEKAKHIRLLILDVDGVLTDGRLLFDAQGNETKVFNVKDGHGLKMLQQAGLDIAIISGRHSSIVEQRMHELDITRLYLGQKNKRIAFEQLLSDMNLRAYQVAYVGDDVIDLPVLTRVGLAIAVADAVPVVKQSVHWISHHVGGNGAVREVCDLLLQAQGHMDKLLQDYMA